jgi:putative ABC transport system ATP-binding protein
MKKTTIIRAENIAKVYNYKTPIEFWALKDISLEIVHGEILAIMGQSGSGKTTLLNCLSGIDKITSGHIFIDGEDLTTMNDTKKTLYRAKNMGFIFQTFNLIPVLSAVENVELPLLMAKVKVKSARRKAIEMLEKVGIADKANNKPSELSGGQRQRVAIARALVAEPKVVWADEPTGNLDKKNSLQVLELIEHLNKTMHTTVVLVTHDPEIAKIADRVIKMDSGAIVQDKQDKN